MSAPGVIQFAKQIQVAAQWPWPPLVLAPPEQLIHRSIQEHGGRSCSFQELNVLRLSKRSASQRYHSGIASEFIDNFAQRFVLNPAKKRLAGFRKYLFDATAVALLYA
jgi:hypothetical protein